MADAGLPRSGVVQRAFNVLGAFDERHTRLPLTTLARRTGLPVNTTLRLARMLVAEGALARQPDGSFVIGSRLYELGTLAPASFDLRRMALPYLQDLHRVSREQVLLSVAVQDHVVLVERLTAHGVVPRRFRVGGRLPMDHSGAGIVLLSGMPFEERNKFIGAATEPQLLRERLHTATRDGFFVHEEDHVATAAAPITVAQETIAAVSIVTQGVEENVRRLVPALLLTARAIARQAG